MALSPVLVEVSMSIFVCRYAKIVITPYEWDYIDFKKKIL
jgi:hypothetical protein